MTEVPDVVVVGAGPAGLAAGAAAAESGAGTLVIDESFRAGGQYLRPHPPELVKHPIVHRYMASGAKLQLRTTVWGIDPDLRRLQTSCGTVPYRCLVIATGAYDRPLPVAGAELRGVVTAGAAQALSKDGVRLGQRVLVAGSGPFAFPVANEILHAGGSVAEVALTGIPWMGTAPLHEAAVIREGLEYARSLLTARVRIRTGWVVTSVLGEGRVTGAVLTRMNQRRRLQKREVACDAVALGYGFLPQLALADVAGCALRYDDVHRTWFVKTDDTLRTSVPDVFAAGEVVGIGGHRKAIADGVLAGRYAARAAGCTVGPTPREVRDFRRLRAFASAAAPFLAPPPLAANIADSALVCRCEGVYAHEIRAAARDGATTIHGVRMRTRCGMGPCQSRLCGQAATEILNQAAGQDNDRSRIAAHIPARPMTIAELAE